MYKLKNQKTVNIFEPIKTVFLNNNISEEDIEWYVNPTPYEHSPLLLENIDKAYELLSKYIQTGEPIHVQVDLDLDGLTSSAILINYLRRVYPEINLTWTNHSPKVKHGIEIDLIPKNTRLLVVPDASSNEYLTHKQVSEMGIDILILDHHMAEKYSEYAVTVNNQLCSYPNKNLSGAGIVYKFIQYIDSQLGLNYSSDYADLCAFGLTGDAMEQSEKETKWLVTKGLGNIKNEFLREIVKENVDEGVKLTPNVISFKCNPKINSLIRVGTQEEIDDLFKALLGHQEITMNPRLRKADKSETWARKMTRTANNSYARQRRIKEDLLAKLEAKIEREKLYENAFMVIEIEDDFQMPMNMSGYIASFLVSKYRRPTLVLRKDEENENQLVGSMRGYDSLMKDTRNFLKGLNLFSLVEGHNQASGLKIDVNRFNLLDSHINEALQHIDLDEDYLVDLILPGKSVTSSFVNDMERYSHVFGKGLEAPTFAVEGLEINLGDSSLMGKDQNMIKFVSNGISYIKFNDADELIKLRSQNKTTVLNVVGRTGVNNYRGNVEPQFIIEAFEILEVKDTARFVF